jgi:hypothetical protein
LPKLGDPAPPSTKCDCSTCREVRGCEFWRPSCPPTLKCRDSACSSVCTALAVRPRAV